MGLPRFSNRRSLSGLLLTAFVLMGISGLPLTEAARPRAPRTKRAVWIPRPGDHSRPPPPLRLADFAPSSSPETIPTPTEVAPPPAAPAAETVAPTLEKLVEKSGEKPGESSGTAPLEQVVRCLPDRDSAEPKVSCSDGKSWTLHSAGLILPPVLRCSPQMPECCQIGFRKMRDVQLADLQRVGEGQDPACHMRVKDFLSNPPSRASASVDRLDDELPPGLRASVHKDCPKGQYLALGGCHDARLLLRALRPPAVSDANRTLVPEAEEPVERMRRDFDATGHCPQAALDIDVLHRIYNAAQLRAELVADTALDISPLLARAQSPGTNQPDAKLPASCGYNSDNKTWYQTTFHCATPNMCFAQSHESLAHTCVRFDRATTQGGGSPYFWPMANCQNVPSCISVASGQCTGVVRLTALGRGIFLMIQEDPSGQPYYYGVLFGRARTRTPAEAAEAKRARALLLDMAHNLNVESERARLRALIDAMPE